MEERTAQQTNKEIDQQSSLVFFQLEDGSELSEDAGMLDPMYVFNLLYISLDRFHGGDNSQQTNKEIEQHSSPVFFQLEDGFELSDFIYFTFSLDWFL